jgi:hypothetical protein
MKRKTVVTALLVLILHMFQASTCQQQLHDYGEALAIAQKFYLANRCGKLPDNKVSRWLIPSTCCDLV